MRRDVRFSVAILLVAFLCSCSPGVGYAQDASGPELQEEIRLLEQGRAAVGLRDYTRAIPLLTRALAIRERASGSTHPSLVPLIDAIGAAHYQLAQFADAARHYQRSLAIQEKVLGPEHPDVATKLHLLAGVFRTLGMNELALQLYLRCLAIREKVLSHNHADTALTLNELAGLYRRMGDLEKALQLGRRALEMRQQTLGPLHPDTAQSLNSLGFAYQLAGQYDKALHYSERAYAIREQTLGPRSPETAQALNNLALLNQTLGRYREAEELFNRSIAIREQTLGHEHLDVAQSLNNLGLLLRSTRQLDRATAVLQRALSIRHKGLGPEHQDTVRAMDNLGGTIALMGRYREAIVLHEQALSVRERRLGAQHPAVAANLANLCSTHRKAGQSATALPYCERAFSVALNSAIPEVLLAILTTLTRLHQDQSRNETAIFFGKQAVNLVQKLRATLVNVDQEIQQSFLESKGDIYLLLTDLLISEGRLPEAQQVLAMLKEEEFFEFIRRDGADAPRATRAGFTGAEAPWVKRYAAVAGRVSEIGTRRQVLEQKRKTGLSTEEAAELKQLESDGDVARKAVVAFLDDLTAEMGKLDARRQKEVARRDVEGLENYQDDLRKLPGAVMLHYVVLPDKVRIIFTSPDTQTGRVANVGEKELNAKIANFRRVLQNPAIDARPLARELYQWLIAPVAADLEQARAQTIMVSLDGTLRYVPIAALHDGKGYMVERYRVTQMTEAAKNNLTSRMDNDNRLTGLGVTRAHEGFDALPSVREELDGILKHGGVKGVTHFDEAFTADSVREALSQRVPLVHVASHFKFNPGTETDSFLLLGDGKRLSLRELREAGFNFRGVDLLTLSACETAVGGGADANGREVEGFGALAQQRGARAVMASLWPVADESTAILMQNFYRLRAQGGDMNKAEALRQAQLLLLQGKHALTTAGARANRGLTSASGERSTPDAGAPYAHPFFWAPFILMGNWL